VCEEFGQRVAHHDSREMIRRLVAGIDRQVRFRVAVGT